MIFKTGRGAVADQEARLNPTPSGSFDVDAVLEQDEKLNKLTKKTDSGGGLTVEEINLQVDGTSLDANLQVDRDRITASGSYIVSSVLDSPFDSVPASPIESRSIYERSLLFGELAAITYHESVDNAEIARVAKNWGFTRIEPYE